MNDSPSATALTLLVAWALLLLVLMEGLRTRLALSKAVTVSAFTPDNANLSPFMQRLARAQSNCVEGLPIFGGLLLIAIVTGRAGTTDTLAPGLVVARLAQSCIHLASVRPTAIGLRFAAFSVQLVIAAWWCWALLAR